MHKKSLGRKLKLTEEDAIMMVAIWRERCAAWTVFQEDWPTLEELAGMYGVTVATVQNYTERLEDEGLYVPQDGLRVFRDGDS